MDAFLRGTAAFAPSELQLTGLCLCACTCAYVHIKNTEHVYAHVYIRLFLLFLYFNRFETFLRLLYPRNRNGVNSIWSIPILHQTDQFQFYRF